MKKLRGGSSGSPLSAVGPLETEGSILALLAEHGSLAYEQVAAHLGEPPDAVRTMLTKLRSRGLVDAFAVGEMQAHGTTAAAYWRLTDAGRAELARLQT
jgi:predicted ArsR family transcriptional regulator